MYKFVLPKSPVMEQICSRGVLVPIGVDSVETDNDSDSDDDTDDSDDSNEGGE